MSRGIRKRIKGEPRDRPTSTTKRSYDFSGIALRSCALAGHGECEGELEVWPLLAVKPMLVAGKSMPTEMVVAACGYHAEMCRADGLLAERLGMRVPIWVWLRAPDPRQQSTIIKETRALRSTARQVPVGVIEERQFPFWQRSEREEWAKEQRFREAVAARDASFDRAWGIVP